MASGPNTELNPGVSGDKVRDIDLGSAIKAQIMFHGDPALITTIRANITTVKTDFVIGPTVSAGTRLAVVFAYVALAASTTADVSVLMGFGAANTPTGTGVFLAHPGLTSGFTASAGSGGGIIGVGADGEEIRITNSVPTTGSLDVIVSYMALPTAGV